MQRRTLVATAVGFAGAALVFAVMFWLVDAGAVLAAVRRGDPAVLAVVAATILCWNVAWGLALGNVLRALEVDVGVGDVLLVHAAGAFANHVTPFGQAGGEPVTAWLLTRVTDTDYEVSLASIASLDAINVVPSLAFAGLGSAYYLATASRGGDLETVTLVVLAVAIGSPLVVAVAWRHDGAVGRGIDAVATPVAASLARLPLLDADDLVRRAAGFRSALVRVGVSRKRLAAAVACSALGWGLQAVGLWLTFIALDSFVPVYVPFLVLPLGKVGAVFPTPGGLGGTEAINVALLSLLTAASLPTIAAAVTVHSVGGYLLTTTVGAGATGVLGVRP